MLAFRVLEFVDHALGIVYVELDFGLGVRFQWRIVRLVPQPLHLHECAGKVLYDFGKLADFLSFACLRCRTVFECAVHLVPSAFHSDLAHERVGRRTRQGVKQGVVCRA